MRIKHFLVCHGFLSGFPWRDRVGIFKGDQIMGKPENAVTRAVRAELKEHGIFAFKVWQGPFSKPGIADLLGVTPDGRFVAVECKTEKGRLSEQQQQFLKKVESHHGIAIVARGPLDVRSSLAEAGIERNQKTLFMVMA